VVICAGLFSGFAVAAEPMEIGVIFSLTGPIVPHGQDALHASQLAVEEINKAGGVLGRPMKLIVEDTESRPKSAVEAAHKLADVNKITVCLGGWSSGIALPTAEYLIIRKQLYEMGVRDFSKFYHYNLSAMAGVPDTKLIEGLKGASYTAAYAYQGVSAGGDKGFNMYGMQAFDVTEKQVIRDGKAVTYAGAEGGSALLPFRYAGEEGITMQYAPSEEKLSQLYPNYKP
jgi:branched-chain amino acid transport system substrate-binding protein